MCLISGRTLPVDVPPDRAAEAQCAGPDRRRLIPGTQLRLDPFPRPSQPGELQQWISILPEQTGERAVRQRAGTQTPRYRNTHRTWENGQMSCSEHYQREGLGMLCLEGGPTTTS